MKSFPGSTQHLKGQVSLLKPSFFRRKLPVLIILSLCITLTFSLLQYTPLFKNWEDNFQSVYYLFKANFSTPVKSQLPIILIKISDKSYPKRFPRSPIDREWSSKLIQEVGQHNPKLIVFNTLLDRKTAPAKDRALLTALKSSKNVVIRFDPRYPNQPEFSEVTKAQGASRYQISSSGQLQSVCNSTLSCGTDKILHHEIEKLLRKEFNLSPKSPFFHQDWLKLNLDLTKNGDTLETVVYPVLESNQVKLLPKGALKNKVIIIETDFPELTTSYRSPVPNQDRALSEGEVLAQTLNMIYNNQFFDQMSFKIFGVILGATLIFISSLFIFFNNFITITTVLGLHILQFFTASYLFSSYNYEVPFVTFTIAIFSFIGITLLYLLGTEKISRLETELSLKQTKIDFLSNELSSHSLFNEFSRLSVMIKKDPEKARLYLIEFAEMLRSSLKNADKISIPIQEQLEYLFAYIAQQQLVYGEKIRFDVKIEEGLEQIKLPWHLFFPFIENAVKYSETYLNTSQEGNAEINVSLTHKNQVLTFEVKNPFVPGQPVASTQTGMKNLQQRLSYLFRNDQFEISSQSHGKFWVSTLVLKL